MKFLRLLLISGMVLVIVTEFYVLLQKGSAPALKRSHYYTLENIKVESIDHRERNVPGEKPFTKYEGDAYGLVWHNNFSILEFFQPASRGRGIASGDFNNDGWQDILLGTKSGVLLYKNLGGRFAVEDLNQKGIPGLNLGVHVAAFVDIDNDGWQDIYITTYGGENYFLLNDTKGFKNPKVFEVPNVGAVVTMAVSFGDLDKDGDLDFVNGNWTSSPTKAGAEINKLLRNNNLEFVEENLQGVKGQTLSVLLADFTNDNNLDLIAGDEFEIPDNFYRGNGKGGLVEITKFDGMIPASARFNMSIDVADFNNDLYMDIYVSGVSTYDIFTENPCSDIQDSAERQKCEKNIEVMDILRGGSIEKCATLTENKDKNECTIMFVSRLGALLQDKTLCYKIPEHYALQRFMCKRAFVHQSVRVAQREQEEGIPQLPWQNVLLQGSEREFFQEEAQEKNVHNAFNSWNAKFADLDNDEWQDIYVGTGELIRRDSIFQPNTFFHNQGGKFFEVKQEEFGLQDLNIVPSYTYVDIDNDGDLDVITVPINGPLNVYINNESQNKSITFEFRDNVGNYFGIGNKIYIYYGKNSERYQVREIKSGGGFLSFDSPIAHFGLGGYDTVSKVEVVWSTGEKTTINKEFLANKKYVISRE